MEGISQIITLKWKIRIAQKGGEMRRNVHWIRSVVTVVSFCFLFGGNGVSQDAEDLVHRQIRKSFLEFSFFLREPISMITDKKGNTTSLYRVEIRDEKGKTLVEVYRDHERKVALTGSWLYGSIIQDNTGSSWLYIVPLFSSVCFYLLPLDECHGERSDLSHRQDATCLRAVQFAPQPGFLSLLLGSLNAQAAYDGKGFRIERTGDRLWVWSVDSSRHIVLSWNLVGGHKFAIWKGWKGLWLNPNLEPIGDPFPSKVPYVEKVLSTLKKEPPTEEDFQRFRALPHGPEKWALGVRLALYGGGKAGEILVDAVQQQRPITEQFPLYEEKRAEYEVRHAFRKMLIELVGLTADRSESARRFLVQRLDQETWKSERWIPWRRGVGLTLSAIGLSGRDDLWKEVLAKRQWIDNGGKEALRYGYWVGHIMVWAAFYHWVIQQVGKERFVREIWFQRPTAEWWERWEKTPQGQDWIQWYARIWNQGLKVMLK